MKRVSAFSNHILSYLSYCGLPPDPTPSLHFMQKALEKFWLLENFARSEGWTAEDRAARFQGEPLRPQDSQPYWPRIFILTQYGSQARLLRMLLQMNHGVTLNIAGNFVVRSALASALPTA